MKQKMPEEMTVEELIEAMDEDAMRIGLTIAELFRTVTTAMAGLPDMELHTESICLSVDNSGITVHVGRADKSGCRECNACEGCEDCGDEFPDFDKESDDEEEKLYDEID